MTDTRNDNLLEQALEWCVLLQDPDAGPEERAGFAAWLETSEAHRQAWRRAEEVWRRLDPLAERLTDGAGQPRIGSPPRQPSRRSDPRHRSPHPAKGPGRSAPWQPCSCSARSSAGATIPPGWRTTAPLSPNSGSGGWRTVR
ncbi:FecR/PupR family sigma factor regulator [Azorhizophilus paspali]|uniref:FecR/PupR family sigma factor regulator n=1 Tax=Azorhizophilus paspali TaxID=69963 RepID=UPI003643FA43